MDNTDDPQLPFPFPLDTAALAAFTEAWCAFEDEATRLREAMTALKDEYQYQLPLRGLLAALKIERTARKVEAHPTEGMARPHVEALRAWVQQYLDERAREVQAVIDEATGEIL
jgi:hypothetical protein